MKKKEKISHPSYQRLAQAAAKCGIHSEADLAVALKADKQQNVNNWQRRGVSKDGALDAERYLGCSATWILDGHMPPCFAPHKNCDTAIPRNATLELFELIGHLDDRSIRTINSLIKKMQHG